MSKVLVIGATQGTGFEVVKELLRNDYEVRVFARNERKARDKFAGKAEIVVGDLQNPEKMPEAVKDADHIIFTAGVTKRPCKEDLIVETEFEGIRKTLEAAKNSGFSGKFLFLSSIGVTKENWASRLINRVKGSALVWRRRMEDEIRKSGFDYVIVRAGFLTNGAGGEKPIELSQNEYPLYLRCRISRADVARVFVEAVKDENAAGKTFDAVWGKEKRNLGESLKNLKKD